MDEKEIRDSVYELIRRASPHKLAGDPGDDELFGDDGLGFDSIARVELLMEINIVLGVSLPPEVFAKPELTVGALLGDVLAAL